jgi:hypothetical protein
LYLFYCQVPRKGALLCGTTNVLLIQVWTISDMLSRMEASSTSVGE